MAGRTAVTHRKVNRQRTRRRRPSRRRVVVLATMFVVVES